MKIYVALYKGKGTWVNSIVRWWTESVYSHAELILPDGVTWMGISPFIKSVVTKRIILEYNPDKWDLVSIDVSQEQLDMVMQFFEDTKGQGYYWVGMLLSQFLPCKIKHRKRWYCSEWIAYALRIACILDWRILRLYDRKDLSPAVLHSLMMAIKNESKEI